MNVKVIPISKPTLLRKSAFLSLFLMIPGLRAQETVTLYLEPDSSGYVVDTVPADDPRLEAASTMGSGGDQPAWKMFELKDSFEGYVEKEGLTKGLTVAAGSMVYFKPETDSAFLTILEAGNQAQVLVVDNEWAKISVPASLPVYFRALAPERIEEAEVEAAEVFLGEPVPPTPAIVDEQVPNTRRSERLTLGETASAMPLDRDLEGRLRRIPQSRIFSRLKYNWELVDVRDKRIAYIDAKNLILLGRSLDTMVGRRVIVSGALSQVDDGRNMLIMARHVVAQ